MKVLPGITLASDVYQIGLVMTELMCGYRFWSRGDRFNLNELSSKAQESTLNK